MISLSKNSAIEGAVGKGPEWVLPLENSQHHWSSQIVHVCFCWVWHGSICPSPL